MARARNIKPGLYKNEDLAECSVWARFIFPGLWMLADRDGLLEDRPKRIKAELLPFDTVDAEPLLAELAAHGFIVRYENEDGKFIFIPTFKDHQSPHYTEKPSGIKPPVLPESSFHEGGSTPGAIPEDSEKQKPIKRGSKPPDSLIPDSLNHESPESAASKIEPSPRARAPDSPRCAALTALAEEGRVPIDARARMHLRQWADEGITDQQMADALAIARERKKHPLDRIPINLLVSIMPDVLQGAKPPDRRTAAEVARDATHAMFERDSERLGEQWWEDPGKVQEKGREEGVRIIPGQPFEEYTARVVTAAGNGPWMARLPDPLRARVEHYRAVGVNP